MGETCQKEPDVMASDTIVRNFLRLNYLQDRDMRVPLLTLFDRKLTYADEYGVDDDKLLTCILREVHILVNVV